MFNIFAKFVYFFLFQYCKFIFGIFKCLKNNLRGMTNK